MPSLKIPGLVSKKIKNLKLHFFPPPRDHLIFNVLSYFLTGSGESSSECSFELLKLSRSTYFNRKDSLFIMRTERRRIVNLS